MKIESSTKPAGASLVKDAPGSTVRKNTSLSGEDVQISGLSAQLSTPDDEFSFDTARVSEIKLAIAEGRFTINSGAIADRLIASAKELLNAQRQA